MTNAEAWCNKSLRPRKPEGSLGRTAQDVHLDSHTAPELCPSTVPIPRSYSFFVSLFLGGGFLFFPFLFFYPSISPVARSQLVFCEVFLYPSTSPISRSHGWSLVRFLYSTTPSVQRSYIVGPSWGFSTPILHPFHALISGLSWGFSIPIPHLFHALMVGL